MLDFIGLLPNHLLTSILARLPVETLIRCTKVCKLWYCRITNPSFINTQINHTIDTDKNHNLYMIHYFSDNEQENYSLVRRENHLFTDYAEFELNLEVINVYLRIIGTCNGLICLSDDLDFYDDESILIYLLNPSIRKLIQLPKLNVIDSEDNDDPCIHIIGFGYDWRSDDYKVVRIAYRWDNCNTPGVVDVFSLRGGAWRDITNSGFPYVIEERAPQAYLNGAAHWFGYDHRGSEAVPLVVSFNMSSEVFGAIMVPTSIPREYWQESVDIAKFQESLSLITRVSRTDYCVWVMKEYGVPESWTLQFNIAMDEGLFHSIAGFTREGQVLVGTEDGYLAAFDPKERVITNPRVKREPAHPSRRDSFYADAYTESLVLLTSDLRDRFACEEEGAAVKVEIRKPKKRGCDQS